MCSAFWNLFLKQNLPTFSHSFQESEPWTLDQTTNPEIMFAATQLGFGFELENRERFPIEHLKNHFISLHRKNHEMKIKLILREKML